MAPFKAAFSVTIRPVNKDNVSHPGFLTAALQLTELIGGQSLKKNGGEISQTEKTVEKSDRHFIFEGSEPF